MAVRWPRAPRGERRRSIEALKALLKEADAGAADRISLEASLSARLKRERAHGGPGSLLKLETDAKSKEYFRIARLARTALERHPASVDSRRMH